MTLPDLQARVEVRRRDLISEIVEHKKNSSRAGAADAVKRATGRLLELRRIVERGGAALVTRRALAEWMSR